MINSNSHWNIYRFKTAELNMGNAKNKGIKNRENKILTTAFGIPVGDDLNSQTAGERGSILMQGVYLYKIKT